MTWFEMSSWLGVNSLGRVLAPRIAIASFVGSMQLSGLFAALTLLRIVSCGPLDPLALFLLSSFMALALAPLDRTDAPWIKNLVAYACASSESYFPARVIVEEESAFTDSAYILGLSPHSAMPTALPVVFSTVSKLLPTGESLRNYLAD